MSTPSASTSSQLAIESLRLLAARDFDGLRAILSPNITLDWPYHQSGSPVLINGVDAFIDAVRVVSVFQSLEIAIVDVSELQHSGTIMIEARSVGVYAGKRSSYANHYIFILTVVDGRISAWREFYNPLAVLKLSARTERKEAAANN